MKNLENHVFQHCTAGLLPVLFLLITGCTGANSEDSRNPPGAVETQAAESDDVRRPVPKDLSATVDALVEQIMADELIPGAAVVVVKDGVTIHKRGYGVADVASGRPVSTDNTLFRIGSISKAFTAFALSYLMDTGKIAADDPIEKYFPLPSKKSNNDWLDTPVRIWHLLTHTSGFDQIGIGRHIWDLEKTLDERHAARPSLTEFLRNDNLRRTSLPGQVFRYDTYGITLAGAILENVTGQRYADAMHTNLFAPLGMRSTSVALDKRTRDKVAVGHGVVDEGYGLAPYEVYVTQPASSIDSTPADMARLLEALTVPANNEKNPWLSSQAITKLLAPQYRPHEGFPGITHGLHEYNLLDVSSRKPIRAIGHGGSMLGFQSSMMLVPELNLGIVVFANRNHEAGGERVSLNDQINRAVVGSFFDGLPFAGFKSGKIQGGRDLSEYEDEYVYGVYCRTCSEEEFDAGGWKIGSPMTIQQRNALLHLRDHDYAPTADPDVFTRTDGQNKIAFRRDEAGAIRSFSFFTSPDAFERLDGVEE
ncbi:MAG: serine hydrolase domain-containing protein [Pseudomonadota bacterium]